MTDATKAIKTQIATFLESRFADKVGKLKDDDPKRETEAARFEKQAWLASAAMRVNQIQLATHLAKGVHPQAKGATSVYASPDSLASNGYVGSQVLNDDFNEDVVGNAAALDVFKFLRLEAAGQTLLQRCIAEDESMAKALSDNLEQAASWMQAFASIARPAGRPAAHTLTKQIYFPLQEGGYHLLAPLYPTSLIHKINQSIRAHRFGEDAKAARQARKQNEDSAIGTHDYPNMAIQKLGGTKPQNVSQLNSERYGDNYLLASLPPNWNVQGTKPPLNTRDIFYIFMRRRSVFNAIRDLKRFLGSLPKDRSTVAIRSRRAGLTAAICDELMQFAGEIKALESGWSAHAECDLPAVQKYWLDPGRARSDEDFRQGRVSTDWVQEISANFAARLNSALRSDKLPMADPEYLHWQREFANELKLVERELDDAA